MKKTLAMVLALAMVFTLLTGCGGGTDEGGDGSGAEYTKIYEANKAVIGENPNRIYAGQELVIP